MARQIFMLVFCRYRILQEGVLNFKQYLIVENLIQGHFVLIEDEDESEQAARLDQEGSNILKMYATNAGFIATANTDPTPREIVNSFKEDMMAVRKTNSQAGMLQMHIAANILKRPINSWLPDSAGAAYEVERHLTNRCVLPFSDQHHGKESINIMWTIACKGSTTFGHFVPVVK